MARTQAEVLHILERGDFEELVGEFESQWLECKNQPYDLVRDERRLELAKDVSALANAVGGLLLLGLSTTSSETHGEDQIDRVRPFPLTLINTDQYRQLLASWLWPPLESVQVRVFPSHKDPNRGVLAIVVPEATEADRPILVTKTLLDSRRRIELLFGYCERKQARVTHFDVRRLHSLLKDGRCLDSEIRWRLDALQASIENRLPVTSAPHVQPPGDIDVRVEAAIRAVGHEAHATFTLVAVPPRALELIGLFESRASPLVQAIDNPPELRNSGFNLNAGGNSRIAGRLRRAHIEDDQLLEAHRDGVMVYITPGDQDRLCWGREQRQREHYLINQLALVEIALPQFVTDSILVYLLRTWRVSFAKLLPIQTIDYSKM